MKYRKTKILMASYFAAGIFVAAGLIFTKAGGAEGYRISQGIEYRRAMAQLVSSISQMDSALSRGQYAEGAGITGKLCAELMSGAQSASTALSILPLETYALEELGEFLSQMEEYARVKGDLACSGTGFRAADREMSGQLQQVTGALVPVLSQLYLQVSEGTMPIRGLMQRYEPLGETGDTYLEDEILELLAQLPDTPTLIYEGSLSDDAAGDYEVVSKLPEVTEEDALQIATDLSGGAELSPMGQSYGALPCYYFGGETEQGTLTVTVSKQGGLPVLYLQEYDYSTETVTAEQARTVGDAFLQQAGYDGVTLHETEEGDGLVKLRYVHAQGDATDPSLCVDVAVGGMGAVVTMNASSFLRGYGSERENTQSTLSAEEAAEKAVPIGLEVLESELTWYTGDTGVAVLCHRFVCKDTANRRCVIYARADTGAQVEIRVENMS